MADPLNNWLMRAIGTAVEAIDRLSPTGRSEERQLQLDSLMNAPASKHPWRERPSRDVFALGATPQTRKRETQYWRMVDPGSTPKEREIATLMTLYGKPALASPSMGSPLLSQPPANPQLFSVETEGIPQHTLKELKKRGLQYRGGGGSERYRSMLGANAQRGWVYREEEQSPAWSDLRYLFENYRGI